MCIQLPPQLLLILNSNLNNPNLFLGLKCRHTDKFMNQPVGNRLWRNFEKPMINRVPQRLRDIARLWALVEQSSFKVLHQFFVGNDLSVFLTRDYLEIFVVGVKVVAVEIELFAKDY